MSTEHPKVRAGRGGRVSTEPRRCMALTDAAGRRVSTEPGRVFRCDRCGAAIPDYLTFGVGRDRNYCLHHIPRWTRFRMWLREWLGR